MDFEGRRELETESRGINHLLDHVRPNITGGQLAGEGGKVKVSSEEPYLLPRLVTGGGGSPPAGGALDPEGVGNHGVPGHLPNAPATAELGPDRGYLYLRLLGGKKGWLIAQGTQKRGHPCSRAHHGVKGVLDPGQTLASGGGVTGGYAPQRSLQSLISPLRLPVGLGVVPRGQTNCGPNPATEGLPDLGRELGPTVRDNVHGDAMKPDHVGHEEVRGLSRGREFREGGEVNHLGEPIDHGQDGGVALG